eukprot:2710834-Amphidinium_carterae.2
MTAAAAAAVFTHSSSFGFWCVVDVVREDQHAFMISSMSCVAVPRLCQSWPPFRHKLQADISMRCSELLCWHGASVGVVRVVSMQCYRACTIEVYMCGISWD